MSLKWFSVLIAEKVYKMLRKHEILSSESLRDKVSNKCSTLYNLWVLQHASQNFSDCKAKLDLLNIVGRYIPSCV